MTVYQAESSNLCFGKVHVDMDFFFFFFFSFCRRTSFLQLDWILKDRNGSIKVMSDMYETSCIGCISPYRFFQ